jgi:hypothetical protein
MAGEKSKPSSFLHYSKEKHIAGENAIEVPLIHVA